MLFLFGMFMGMIAMSVLLALYKLVGGPDEQKSDATHLEVV